MKKDNTEIIFVTEYEGFANIKELRPYPASEYMPEWFRKLPADIKLPNEGFSEEGHISKIMPNVRTAKLCPSFTTIYNEGFVLPAPCDIFLRVDDNGDWEWKVANPLFGVEEHGDHQYANHEPNVKKVFKLIYPYQLIVPKGYSIRQVPMFYDWNKDWQVAYGVFEADKIPEIAIQILYTSDKEEVVIKAGTPLCYYVPYKRESYSMVIGDYKEHKDKILEGWHRGVTTFKNASAKFLNDKTYWKYRDAKKK